MSTTLGFVCKEEAKAGEDMFNQDRKDLVSCMWYDEMQRSQGNVPLLQLNDHINILLDEKAIPKTWGKPATGPTFNSKYPIEFAGRRLRAQAMAHGRLLTFQRAPDCVVWLWLMGRWCAF